MKNTRNENPGAATRDRYQWEELYEKMFFLFLPVVILLLSCAKQETETNGLDSQDGKTFALQSEAYENNSSEQDNSPDLEEKTELQHLNAILPDDIKNMGIGKEMNFGELAGKLSDDQLNKISKIRLDDMIVESFGGLSRFVKLQTLDIKNSRIKNLDGITYGFSQNWLYLSDSEIGSLAGLSKIEDLCFLSLGGSHVVDLSGISFPDSLTTIVLSNFSQFDKILNILPANIEQIYLDSNGIKSMDQIEALKNRYPKLMRIFIKNNEIPLEVIRETDEEWNSVELIWWDNI